jgi:hypothetical protein
MSICFNNNILNLFLSDTYKILHKSLVTVSYVSFYSYCTLLKDQNNILKTNQKEYQ